MLHAPQNGQATDWSTAYTQYLLQSTAHATNTLELYQNVLRLVAAGKLQATAFQDYVPEFTSTHGSELSKQMTELGASFLSQLVSLQDEFAQTQSSTTKTVDEQARIAPPSFEVGEPHRWFEQLAEYAGKLNARSLKAYREQLEQVASGEKTPAEVQQSATASVSHTYPEYLQNMTGLYFDLLNGLNEIRAKYEQEYFRNLLMRAGQPAYEPPVLLPVRGTVGEIAKAFLTVGNTTQEPTTLQYAVTDVRQTSGEGPAFSPSLQITPSNLQLEPKEEKQLELNLLLDGAKYASSVPYVCDLYISGGNGFQVEVRLEILASAPSHPLIASELKEGTDALN